MYVYQVTIQSVLETPNSVFASEGQMPSTRIQGGGHPHTKDRENQFFFGGCVLRGGGQKPFWLPTCTDPTLYSVASLILLFILHVCRIEERNVPVEMQARVHVAA